MKAFFHSTILMILVFLVGCSENNGKSNLSITDKINNVPVEVSIEGMSCMACVAKVKKTLSDLNGVDDVKVSLENKSATFQYSPQNISFDKIKQSIDEIGYKVGTVKELSK
jgi:copper ion binding protein